MFPAASSPALSDRQGDPDRAVLREQPCTTGKPRVADPPDRTGAIGWSPNYVVNGGEVHASCSPRGSDIPDCDITEYTKRIHMFRVFKTNRN